MRPFSGRWPFGPLSKISYDSSYACHDCSCNRSKLCDFFGSLFDTIPIHIVWPLFGPSEPWLTSAGGCTSHDRNVRPRGLAGTTTIAVRQSQIRRRVGGLLASNGQMTPPGRRTATYTNCWKDRASGRQTRVPSDLHLGRPCPPRGVQPRGHGLTRFSLLASL